MTLTPEQRLDQLERILATTIRLTQSNSEAIAHLTEGTNANSEAIDRLTHQMAQLSDMFVESVGIIRTMQADIQAMQGEIRGMQTENQRILRHLFGETEN
jgi:Ni2+-binding GTPase involved in maturation of urease and hydrogenase